MQGEFQGSFGDFLAMKRKEADLTIKDVSQWLHISTAYYSYFESGERKAPERLVLDRLAVILDLSPPSVFCCMTWQARRAGLWRPTYLTISTHTLTSVWRFERPGIPRPAWNSG